MRNLFRKLITITFVVCLTFACLAFVSANNSTEINAAGAFSITYDGNGATGGEPPTTVLSIADNEIVQVGAINTLEKACYVFDSWNTKSDGSGTKYEINDEITVTENITLYAIWKRAIAEDLSKDNDYKLSIVDEFSTSNGYTITYDWQSGNPTTPATEYTGEVTFPSSTVLESAGYYCRVMISKGSFFRIINSNVFYPKEICFDGNGGSGTSPVTIYQLEGRTITMPSNPYTKNGYKFLGWNSDQGATEAMTFNDGKYTVSDHITFYAIWKEIIETEPSKDNNYTVTLKNGITDATYQWQESGYDWGFSYVYFCNYSNGRTLDGNTTSLSSNCYFEIGNAKAIRFKYAGTSTITNCVQAADGYYYPPYNEVTRVYDLTASSSDNDHPITDIEVYDIGIKYSTIAGETSATLGNTNLENKYYRCLISLTSGETAASTVLVPKTVTLDGNGSTGGTGTTLYQLEGRNIQLPSCPFTKTGYSFVGWNTDKDATSGLANVVMGSTDTTLYAIWQINSQNDSGYKVVNTSTTGNNHSLKFVSFLSMVMLAGTVVLGKKKH